MRDNNLNFCIFYNPYNSVEETRKEMMMLLPPGLLAPMLFLTLVFVFFYLFLLRILRGLGPLRRKYIVSSQSCSIFKSRAIKYPLVPFLILSFEYNLTFSRLNRCKFFPSSPPPSPHLSLPKLAESLSHSILPDSPSLSFSSVQVILMRSSVVLTRFSFPSLSLSYNNPYRVLELSAYSSGEILCAQG